MFGSKPFAGAREARLNFVGNKENAVFAADILEQLEVIAGRNDEAAFAENGLGNNCGDGLRRDGAFEGVFEMVREFRGRCSGGIAIWIREGNAVDVAREGLEACFVRMRLAGER